MLKNAIFIAFVLSVCVFLSTRAVNSVANWYQFEVNNAYNKGRDMERVCSTDPEPPNLCDNHNSNVGHNARMILK